MQSSRLRARYRYIMGFFTRATVSFIFWEILLPRSGLRGLASRTRSQRYKQIAAQFRAMAIRMGVVMIKEAMERGEFDNLSGKGKPIDLTEYFEMPEEVRLAHSMLKNAGMTPREVDLLKEIAELKQLDEAMLDEKKKQEIAQKIEHRQVEFNLMMGGQ